MNILSLLLQTLVGGIGIGSLYALVALGQSMVYRSMGFINFANGSIYMIGTYFGIIWYRGMVMGLHVPYALAFFIGIALNACLGVLLARIFRPLANLDLRLTMLATIGLAYVLDNLAIIGMPGHAEGFAVNSPLSDKPIIIGGVALLPQMLLLIFIAGVLMVLLNMFLTRAKIGIAMRAAAQDRETASAMGISVNATNALTFAIGSGLAAAAGILAAPIVYVNPAMGSAVGQKGFAAFILGGAGSIPGAIVGGLTFGVLEAISAGFISSAYTKGIAFVVTVMVLMLKPSGMVGEARVDKV